MIINKALNIVIPVQRSDGVMVYVHSTPVSRTVFDTYFLVISKTFTAIYEEGLGRAGGPRIAAMLMKKIAQQMQAWDGPSGVENGLIGEIRRLTLVIAPGANGWEQIPYSEAVRNGQLDEDDVSEVENALCFFTALWLMHKKTEREPILQSLMPLWGAQLTLSTATEYTTSLRTSTAGAPTGETPSPTTQADRSPIVTSAASPVPF